MKKFKITAVILASLMLMTSFMSAAFAFSTDDLNALGQYFGGNNNTTDNKRDPDEPSTKGQTEIKSSAGLSGILQGILGNAANGLTNSQLNDILNNFDISKLLGGDSEILNEVMDYIASFGKTPGSSTTNPPAVTDAPTDPPVSEPPTSAVPSYTYIYVPQTQQQPTYVYVPQTEPATVPVQTTAVEETTVVAYVPPEQIFTDILTTGVYPTYAIEEDNSSSENSGTFKTVAGLVIIVISLVAVVGVSVALKKSRI